MNCRVIQQYLLEMLFLWCARVVQVLLYNMKRQRDLEKLFSLFLALLLFISFEHVRTKKHIRSGGIQLSELC